MLAVYKMDIIKKIEQINIMNICMFLVCVILILNVVLMHIYWEKFKNYKCLPLAIHITEKLFKYNCVNNSIKDKLVNLYICDKWEDIIRKFYYKKITIIIFIIIGVNVLAIYSWRNSKEENNLINNQYISKPKYGEKDKNVNLTVQLENKKGKKDISKIEINIKPNRLSAFEKENLIVRVKEYIRKNVLADNEKYGEINKKLNLITSYEYDENIKINWKLDDYGLISSSGNIDYSNVDINKIKNGIDVVLTANISYFEDEYEYPIYMTIIEKQINRKDEKVKKLKENINNSNNKYTEDGILVLPEEIGNTKVTYNEEKTNNKVNSCIIIILLGIIGIIAINNGLKKEVDNEIIKKNSMLIMYYSEIITKLQLLLCAGLNIMSAWEKICLDYLQNKKDKNTINYAYEEMVYTYRRIKMGMPQIEAFKEFGKRIGISNYVKMSALILQSIRTGSEDFIDALELEQKNTIDEKKEIYINKGEKLGINLLIPMIILMGITMIIVIIPAFISL